MTYLDEQRIGLRFDECARLTERLREKGNDRAAERDFDRITQWCLKAGGKQTRGAVRYLVRVAKAAKCVGLR